MIIVTLCNFRGAKPNHRQTNRLDEAKPFSYDRLSSLTCDIEYTGL